MDTPSKVCVIYNGKVKIAWVVSQREADYICDMNPQYQWDFVKYEKCARLSLYNDIIASEFTEG